MVEKERERKRGLIEEGKRERESKRAHVIPEFLKLKARSLSIQVYSDIHIYIYMN